MADDNDFQDPALKHFNRNTFIVKNTVMETLKGALLGAAIGAAVFGVAMIALPFLLPVIGPFLGSLGLAGMASGAVAVPTILTTAIANGAIVGGSLGAVTKGAMAMSGANEAADAEEDRLITKNQQTEQRKQRLEALEQRRDMQKMALDNQTMAIRGQNPNMMLPQKASERGLM